MLQEQRLVFLVHFVADCVRKTNLKIHYSAKSIGSSSSAQRGTVITATCAVLTFPH